MASETNGTTAQPVVVSLHELEKGTVSLSTLEEAFGPSSLGIIIVKDLPPQFAVLRHRVLSYSSWLANLPKAELAQLENPQASYLTGWSHGKETLHSGRFDTHKGSFYLNCAFHQDPALDGDPAAPRYPGFEAYTAPNAWPAERQLPGFQAAARALCSLVIEVAGAVAGACDAFGEARVEGYEAGGCLRRVVAGSMTTKARLLHYFPAEEEEEGEGEEDDWCATHVDHGCLTGLTAAMYVDEAAVDLAEGLSDEGAVELPELDSPPDPSAGLYIRARTGERAHVRIPRDCLAFQTGQALELMTKGRFKAVPHFVKGIAAGRGGAGRVARNTLAVFTQPNLWEMVDREAGLDFAAFSKRIVESTY